MDNRFFLNNIRLGGAHSSLTVEEGTITALGGENTKSLPERDGGGALALPGFLDLHTHGAAGVDVNAAGPEGLRKIARFFAAQGVTGWQ